MAVARVIRVSRARTVRAGLYEFGNQSEERRVRATPINGTEESDGKRRTGSVAGVLCPEARLVLHEKRSSAARYVVTVRPAKISVRLNEKGEQRVHATRAHGTGERGSEECPTEEGASPTAAELLVVEELTAATAAAADTGKKEDAGASSDPEQVIAAGAVAETSDAVLIVELKGSDENDKEDNVDELQWRDIERRLEDEQQRIAKVRRERRESEAESAILALEVRRRRRGEQLAGDDEMKPMRASLVKHQRGRSARHEDVNGHRWRMASLKKGCRQRP
ncbi:hypothetical protein PC123_g20466 [Phytophthora cactorum]|nr:hypothetical protein PC123_g20466 [Phytophthora cactorum]